MYERKKNKIRKTFKFLIAFFLIAIFGFSNLAPVVLNKIGQKQLAEKFKIKEAQAAIEFVGRNTASGSNAAYNLSLTALTGGIASSPSQGDIVIVVNTIVNTTDGNPGVGTSGYTELADLYISDTYDTNLSANYKIMGASPDTTVSCNPSSGSTLASDCVAMVFRGIDTTTPIDVTGTTATSANSEDVNCPSITPVTSGAVVVCTGGAAGASVDQATPTAPSGYSGSTYIQTDPGSSGAAVASYKLWSGSGAEDPAAYVMDLGTASANSWAAVTLALRPINNPPTLNITQPDGVGDTVTVGDLYNITYDLNDPDNVVTAAFYYDTDTASSTGLIAISGCSAAAEGTGATCSWNTTGVTPGSYYVYASTTDGVNPYVSDYSPGVITINAPANNLTIGVTSGPKFSDVASGDSSVYTNTTSCSGPSSCAAFTLLVSNTSVTVSSIKITEASTTNATADLSQLALFYDTDGNYSNGVTGQYGTTVASFTSEAATVSGSLALTPATTYYFYVRFNASSTTPSYPKGGQTINFQIAANADVTLSSGSATITGAPVAMAGPMTVTPRMTGITYGSGLSDGARSSEAITISGYGFGVAPGGSRANCAGAVDTGCVRFLVGGATTVADADVSSWSNTSIGWTVSTTLATLGGASALELVAGSATSTAITYYIYPRIVSLTNCDKSGFPAGDFAREYDSADSACPNGLTDGAIVINGDHFDTAGSVSILGITANQSAVSGFCGGSAYSATCIAVQASSSIADNSYTGNVAVTRNADSKSDTRSGFRILPRITGFSPTGAPAGDPVTVIGNHFCQAGAASCPTVFDSNNKITFTSNISSTVFTGWSNTSATTTVPNGAATGDVVLKSNSYDSNGKNFNVYSNIPSDPTNLNQFRNSALTQIITTSSPMVSSTPIYLTMTMEVPGISGGTLYSQIEYKAVGTPFSCGAGACASAVEGNGKAGPGPWDCSNTGNACAISISPTDNSYHWQARVRHNKGGSDYYSSWVSFGGNLESETDFQIDANAPTISNIATSSVSTNSATITWNTNEGATSQVQYNTTGSFVSDCATYNDCTTLDPSYATSHTVNLSNLNSGTTYYFRVRSKDIAGNEAISSNYQFDTTPVGNAPAKTVVYYAYATTSVISAGATASSSFSVFMPEASASTTSAFLELTGLSLNSGTVQVWVNSQTAKTYTIPSNKNLFKIIYKVDGANVNVEPTASSTVYVNPSIDTYVVSSRFIITYKYTP